MIKLPTVKVGGKTAFVINRHEVEDDIAVAEAISRDAARWRWLREHWNDKPGTHPVDSEDIADVEKYIDERI